MNRRLDRWVHQDDVRPLSHSHNNIHQFPTSITTTPLINNNHINHITPDVTNHNASHMQTPNSTLLPNRSNRTITTNSNQLTSHGHQLDGQIFNTSYQPTTYNCNITAANHVAIDHVASQDNTGYTAAASGTAAAIIPLSDIAHVASGSNLSSTAASRRMTRRDKRKYADITDKVP